MTCAASFTTNTSDGDDEDGDGDGDDEFSPATDGAMIRTPNGMMSEEDARALFREVGFNPPPQMSTQEAFIFLVEEARRQAAQERAGSRSKRGRTAEMPEPATAAAAVAVMESFGAEVVPMKPCGVEIKGVDVAGTDDGRLPPAMSGALEMLMATHGFILLRGQGVKQNESGVPGVYLSAEQQCRLSECFGAGSLHSTHGVHPESPCRDVFRLSNDPKHGFNSVGTEWHNDGSFCRDVFGHVVYHIVKAPDGPGDTVFAHLVGRYPPSRLHIPYEYRSYVCTIFFLSLSLLIRTYS